MANFLCLISRKVYIYGAVTYLLDGSLTYLMNGAPKSRKIPIAEIRSTYKPRSPPIWLLLRMTVSGVTYFFSEITTEA